jgi:hypothetical protein
MPPYLTTPPLATQLQLTPEAIDELESTDTSDDIEWLLAFLSADRLACYCLYQSASPRVVLTVSRRSAPGPGTIRRLV